MLTLLEIHNLTTSESMSRAVLRGINLDLCRGEVLGVIGENGSGKTTLVKVLSGLSPTYSGDLFINGSRVEIKSLREAARYKIATVYEDTPLNLDLSVEENIYQGLLPTVWPIKKVVWRRLRESTQKLLENFFINIDPGTLLRNLKLEEKQMVAICKALARNPDVLVLDEPSKGLRESQVAILFSLIRKCTEQGMAVIYLTRRLEEVLQVADRVSILYEGRIHETVPIIEARKHPEKILWTIIGKENGVISSKGNQAHSDEMKGLMDTLLHTSELLASEYELQDVLEFMAKKAMTIMTANSCIIQIMDEDTGTTVNKIRYGESEFLEAGLKDTAVHKIIEKGEPFYIEDTASQDSLHDIVSETPGAVRAFLCVPIKIRSRIAGVIQMFYNEPHNFIADEIEVISTFANQAAVAIENTRLLGRSALLQEAHHRIKNNLQSIISLLSLQLDFKEFKSVDEIINDSISRIKAIAAVHDMLSRDENGIGVVNSKNIIETVVSSLVNRAGNAKLFIAADNVMLSYRRAASLALVVNELVSNCLKHAFPGRTKNRIDISMISEENCIAVEIKDNGIGLPENFDRVTSGNLGLSIVQTLVRKDLQGEFFIRKQNGTVARVIMPRE